MEQFEGGNRWSFINNLHRAILEANPIFIGEWSVLDPDVLERNDLEYQQAPGSEAGGRFVPYWYRAADGSIAVEPLKGYDVPREGDYNLLERNSGETSITNPYLL